MPFKLKITLTEEDYRAFNFFHLLESTYGKKIIRKQRILYIAASLLLMILVVVFLGWSEFSIVYVVLLSLFMSLYMLFYKKIFKRSVNNQINKLKKLGKLPFESVSELEFCEDRIIETTPTKRMEQMYSVLERLCVVNGRYMYLYTSSMQAYLLPMVQVEEQFGKEAFIEFIAQKCSTVEYY